MLACYSYFHFFRFCLVKRCIVIVFFQIVCAAVMPTSDMDLVCTGDKFGSMGIWLIEVILFLIFFGPFVPTYFWPPPPSQYVPFFVMQWVAAISRCSLSSTMGIWIPIQFGIQMVKRGWRPNGPVFEYHLNTRQTNHLNTRRMDIVMFSYVLVRN